MLHELPLSKANRIRLARAFWYVPRVDLSIDCVIEGQMGKAFVDDIQKPTVFKIQIGPFFYFAGNPNSNHMKTFLENIDPYTLFMPSLPGWIEAAKEMYQKRLISFDRYSFSGEHLSLRRMNDLIGQSNLKSDVKRMDLAFAERLWSQEHFVDLSDFDSPADFVERGVGYFIQESDEVIGAAYSSLVCSKGIEVSLFVMEDHRRKGIATVLSGKLLKWCLENHAEANWDAANPESCKLAEKLGYQKRGTYQAYYIQG